MTATPQPRALEDAPRDGTMLRILVDYSGPDADHALDDVRGTEEPAWTIGFNQYDHTGLDEWYIAGWSWTQDCWTDGRGKVVGWLPFHGETVPLVEADAQRFAPTVADWWFLPGDSETGMATLREYLQQMIEMDGLEVGVSPVERGLILAPAYVSVTSLEPLTYTLHATEAEAETAQAAAPKTGAPTP